MAYDAFTLAVIGIGAGAILGAVNSIVAWIKNNEEFIPKKFALTVLTGIGAALVLVFAQISGIVSAQTNYEILTQIAMLGFAIFGVNWFRSAVSEGISNRAVEKIEES